MMNCRQLGIVGGLVVSGIAVVGSDRALAQSSDVVPDKTLGAENSVVTPVDSATDRVEGGAIRGSNLFHSFQKFNIGDGNSIYFANPASVTNIFSRVTGGSPSDIQGLLRAQGNANLFLMNPNGILFGPNAQLDIGGSFIATTANAIQFPGGAEFSRNSPVAVGNSLLSVNPSAFLFDQIAAQPITNQAVEGLQVADGQSLLLLGGDVGLDGGSLFAPGGRVELGGVAAGTVGLSVDSNNLSLSYTASVQRADVSLTNEAGVDVTASGGGSIAVNARNLNLSGESYLDAGIGEGLGSPDAQAGDITLNTTEAVTVTNSFIFNDVSTEADGNAGNLTIDTKRLSILDGGQVGSVTNSEGNAGNLTIRAAESIDLNAGDAGTLTGLFNQVSETGNGMGGNTLLEAKRLSISNGAQVAAITFGKGKVGDLTVQASETVEISGQGDFRSGIFSELGPRSSETVIGNGGNLTVETRSLILSDQAKISTEMGPEAVGVSGSLNIVTNNFIVRDNSTVSAQTYGKSDAGSMKITTDNLLGTNGSQISSSTFGTGNAGILTIDADAISFDEVNGEGSPSGVFSVVGENAEGNGGNVIITTGSLSLTNGGQLSTLSFGKGNAGNLNVRVFGSAEITGTTTSTSSGLFASAIAGTGNGGNLTLVADQLVIKDGATISVSNFQSRNLRPPGTGTPGNLNIEARSIQLNKEGNITAATASGEGGNINLKAADILLMRRNSEISAQADGTGNGGNIALNTKFLVAFPEENSDIIANAIEGKGGNINIKATSIFGFQSSNSLTSLSDINASSEFGVDGVVEINTPDVDLQNSLTQLAANFASPDQVVAGSCLARRNVERGGFTVTGTGGLPRNPYEAISGRYMVTSVQPLPGSRNVSSDVTPVEPPTTWKLGDAIQEAQGMTVTADGRTIVGTSPQLLATANAHNLICHPD